MVVKFFSLDLAFSSISTSELKGEDEPAPVVQMDAPAIRVQPKYEIVPVHTHPLDVPASEEIDAHLLNLREE